MNDQLFHFFFLTYHKRADEYNITDGGRRVKKHQNRHYIQLIKSKKEREFCEAVFGKESERYSVKKVEKPDDENDPIQERFAEIPAAPNYQKCLDLANELRETTKHPIVPKSVLPSYLRVIDSMPQTGGKWNCVFLWDQVPASMQREDPIERGTWELSFDVPLPEPEDDKSRAQLKLNLLEHVLKRVIDENPTRHPQRVKTFETELPKGQWDESFLKLSEEEQKEQLSETRKIISDQIEHQDTTWSYKLTENVREYFTQQDAEKESIADGTVIDGSKYIRVLARVEREAWECIDSRNRRFTKPPRLKKNDPSAKVHLNVSGIGFKLQGRIKDGFYMRQDYCFSGGREIGKTFANFTRGHLIALTFPHAKIVIFRDKLSTLQNSVLKTYGEQILEYMLDGSDSCIKVDRDTPNEPKGFYYPNGSAMQLTGLRDTTDVLSDEWDFGIGVQMDGITQDDVSYIKTSLGRGAGKNTPYSGIIFGDSNPDMVYGEEHWLLHNPTIRLIKVGHRDNPAWWDREKKELTAYGKSRSAIFEAMSGNTRDRLRDGIWGKNKMLVYPEFDKSKHIVDSLPPQMKTETEKVVLACDWGSSQSPTVYMLWALYQKTWYFVRGFARLGITSQETLREVAEEYMRFAMESFSCEISAAYPDPSGKLENQALRDAGLNVQRPSDMNINTGIKIVQEALKSRRLKFWSGAYAFDGICEIMIERRMALTPIDEFLKYAFPETRSAVASLDTNPIKQHDHWMDPTRYLGVSELKPQPAIYISVETVSKERILGEPEKTTPRWKRHMGVDFD